MWSQLYNTNFGLINQSISGVYHFFGLNWSPPGWLTSTRSLLGFLPWPEYFNNGGFGLGAREAIMIMGIWAGIGGNNMLLYLAALSNIPPDLNEAADIDGPDDGRASATSPGRSSRRRRFSSRWCRSSAACRAASNRRG